MAEREGQVRTSERAAGAPESAPVMSLAGGDLASLVGAPPRPGVQASIDRFEIIREIGRGGMGVVLLARDSSDGKQVAIKVITPALAQHPQAVHRFLVEARHMSRLAHPNILPVLEVSDRPQGPYFVMPYMERGSLARLIEPGRPVDDATAMTVARGVAEALQFAHSRGITHRDLKPDNILLDSAGNAFLSDFGLARTVFNDSIMDVRQSHLEGTVAYMAPEIARGEAGDGRCDIYSWGALVYEMLTGAPPYEAQTSEALLRRASKSPPTPILQRNPKAPAGLVRIVDGAMARDLRDRYATMADAVEDIDRAANRKWPLGAHRRKRSARRIVAGVVTGAVILVAAGIWFWPRSTIREPAATQYVPAPVESVRAAPPTPSQWRLKLVRVIELDVGAELNMVEPVRSAHGATDAICLADRELSMVVLSHDERGLRWRAGSEIDKAILSAVTEGDLSLDGDEIFVATTKDTEMSLLMLNQWLRPSRVWRATGSVHFPKKEDGGSTAGEKVVSTFGRELKVVDLDGDDHRDLIATATTPKFYRDGIAYRGILRLDFEQPGSPSAEYRIAPAPEGLEIGDFDRDGKQEIFLGSGAVDNGNHLDDGTDDSHAYLYCLDHDLKLNWRCVLGGSYTHCTPYLVDLDGNGTKEIVAWVRASRDIRADSTEIGRVVELDAQGKELHRYDCGVESVSLITADVDGNGDSEIVLSDRNGLVHALGAGLVPERPATQVIPPASADATLQFAAFQDIDGDGKPEFLATCAQRKKITATNPGDSGRNPNFIPQYDNDVMLLSPALRIVARHRIANQWERSRFAGAWVIDAHQPGKKLILVSADFRLFVLEFRAE